MRTARRERLRTAALLEIREAARQVLVKGGPDSLTLRAVAREAGLTASALYRYFASREDLVHSLIDDIDYSLAGALRAAAATIPVDDRAGRFLVACTEFRRWALDHAYEYQTVQDALPVRGCSGGTYSVFLDLFEELCPDVGDLAKVRAVFLGCWIRLHGFVTLEVRGRLSAAVGGVTPLFEYLMADIAADIDRVACSVNG